MKGAIWREKAVEAVGSSQEQPPRLGRYPVPISPPPILGILTTRPRRGYRADSGGDFKLSAWVQTHPAQLDRSLEIHAIPQGFGDWGLVNPNRRR
jgi:hypothetical protein